MSIPDYSEYVELSKLIGENNVLYRVILELFFEGGRFDYSVYKVVNKEKSRFDVLIDVLEDKKYLHNYGINISAADIIEHNSFEKMPKNYIKESQEYYDRLLDDIIKNLSKKKRR